LKDLRSSYVSLCPDHPQHPSLPQTETSFLIPCVFIGFNGSPLFKNALLGLDMPGHPKGNFAHDASATGLPAMLVCILTTRSGTSHFQKKCMFSLF
jgi:hypothetical protein